jgi:hypothetical protein
MYVPTDQCQRFAPSQYIRTPAQPVSYAAAPPWQPTEFRWVDVINAALNDYLKHNWQDGVKWVIQELNRPEPRPRRKRRYR